jgi:hemoglobin/transferrin/lactoferrin receptor protein
MRFILRLLGSSACLATATMAAPAAEADPDATITVTATRVPQSVDEVPAVVTVIDAARIADELASDIRDLIRFEPGVSVRRSPSRFGAALGATGRGGAEGFNIRGIEGNRVLIQVDGVRVPDGFSFGAQSAGRGDYVDLGLIKSVEILRGPASALYGSDGLAGAVSFVTSDPSDLLAGGDLGGLARVAYDSADEEWSETGVVAGRSGAWSALLAYTRRDGREPDNKGAIDAPNVTRTVPNPQDTGSDAVLAKLVWQPDDSHRVRLTLDHLDARVDTNVLSGRAVVPPPPALLAPTAVIGLTAKDTTKRDRVSLDWRMEREGLVDYLQLTGWYQNGRSRQFSAEDRNTAADRTRLNTFDNRIFGASVEARSLFATGAAKHLLLYGGDISVTRQRGLRDGTVPTPPDVFPTRAFPVTDFTLAGIYLADNIEANDWLSLYPVLRFDHYKIDPRTDPLLPAFFTGSGQSGSKLSPKLGAVVKPAEGINLFANYARGFQAPSPIEINQFFDNPSATPFAYRTLRNPDLKPETSETVEGGIRVKSGGVSAGVTAFRGKYRDFISQVQLGGIGTVANPVLFQYVNLNRVTISGIEGRVDARLPGGLTAQASIAYAKGDQFDAANVKTPLLSVDPLKLVAGIGYRADDDRFGGQIVLTHSDRKAADRTTGQCTPTCFRPGAYTVLDATAFVRLGNALTARAGLFNLTDKKYIPWSDVRGLASTSTVIDAFTQPGRNVSASLSYRF